LVVSIGVGSAAVRRVGLPLGGTFAACVPQVAADPASGRMSRIIAKQNRQGVTDASARGRWTVVVVVRGRSWSGALR